ncbi:MAG: ParB/Srx family N-terminal domain-containing protein [Pseudomonadota bacterium]
MVYRRPGDLKRYGRNARRHPPEQVEQIAAAILEWGFTNPILLRDDEETIGAGHGRFEAVELLLSRGQALPTPDGETVPTITLRGLTDDQWRAYVIADNKLALNSSWDLDVLAAELRSLEGGTADLSLIGFGEDELDELLRETVEAAQAPEAFPEYGEDIETEHKCPKCGYAWSGEAA